MFPRLLTFNSEVWKLNWSSPQWSDPKGAIEKQRRRSIQVWSHETNAVYPVYPNVFSVFLFLNLFFGEYVFKGR